MKAALLFVALASAALAAPLVRPVPPCVFVGKDTGSMRGTIDGDPALGGGFFGFLEARKAADVKVGELIVFEQPRRGVITVHVCVEKHATARGTYLIAKGVANGAPDPIRITDAELIGVATIAKKP